MRGRGCGFQPADLLVLILDVDPLVLRGMMPEVDPADEIVPRALDASSHSGQQDPPLLASEFIE